MEKSREEKVAAGILHTVWLASILVCALSWVHGINVLPIWLVSLSWMFLIFLGGIEVWYWASGECGGRVERWVERFNCRYAGRIMKLFVAGCALMTIAGWVWEKQLGGMVFHLGLHILPLLVIILLYDVLGNVETARKADDLDDLLAYKVFFDDNSDHDGGW